jgi:hypothetical protein
LFVPDTRLFQISKGDALSRCDLAVNLNLPYHASKSANGKVALVVHTEGKSPESDVFFISTSSEDFHMFIAKPKNEKTHVDWAWTVKQLLSCKTAKNEMRTVILLNPLDKVIKETAPRLVAESGELRLQVQQTKLGVLKEVK